MFLKSEFEMQDFASFKNNENIKDLTLDKY